MLRTSPFQLAWWNYKTEFRQKWMLMYGGNRTQNTFNARHRIYVKKFRKNAFPNRTRQHWSVAQTGLLAQRPNRLTWPYDLSSMIFNQHQPGGDKIGYVVGNKMTKTAIVASQYLVYYPKFNQRVARTGRYFAHDEDMASVEGDLVHIRACRKISKYKHYYIFSILEPNIEARERLKLGLPAVPPPMFGYPVNRRIIKLNLTEKSATGTKTAASIQEHVQDVYRYAGPTGDSPKATTGEHSFEEAQSMIAPNAGIDTLEGGVGAIPELDGGFDEVAQDERPRKGEDLYHSQSENVGTSPFGKFSKSA